MPAKRSRIGRSTSSGDIDVMPPSPARRVGGGMRVPAAGNSAKAMKTGSAVEERSGETRPRILTVSSPVHVSEVAGPVPGFLERCYACKKEIREDADVFMYSLRAFCSVECRERQVLLDNVAEVASTACKRPTT